MAADRIQALWGRYDETSAALVRANRASREGRGSEQEVDRLQIDLLDLVGRWSAGWRTEATKPRHRGRLANRQTGRATGNGAST
jgi:hypothetical protein